MSSPLVTEAFQFKGSSCSQDQQDGNHGPCNPLRRMLDSHECIAGPGPKTLNSCAPEIFEPGRCAPGQVPHRKAKLPSI